MDPLIYGILISVPGAFLGITVHGFSQALASLAVGDKAPKNTGRLTLNPFKHFEAIGFILLLIFNVGWCKPISTSALHYKNRKRGLLIVGAAPILANIMFGIIFALIAEFSGVCAHSYLIYNLLAQASVTFICLAAFNILPVAPLAGSKLLAACISHDAYIRHMRREKILLVLLILLTTTHLLHQFFLLPIVNFILGWM